MVQLLRYEPAAAEDGVALEGQPPPPPIPPVCWGAGGVDNLVLVLNCIRNKVRDSFFRTQPLCLNGAFRIRVGL